MCISCRFPLIIFRKKVIYSANIYLFKVNNRNTRKKSKICSKLTIETPDWRHWRCSGVFYCYLGTHFISFSKVSIVDFEQVKVTLLVPLISKVFLSTIPFLFKLMRRVSFVFKCLLKPWAVRITLEQTRGNSLIYNIIFSLCFLLVSLKIRFIYIHTSFHHVIHKAYYFVDV